MRLLTVNAGSTSIKISLLDGEETIADYPDLDSALDVDLDHLDGVVHRVVHGGDRAGPAAVDDDVREELERLTELAPLHQPPALAAIDSCRERLPDLPHVACFDTTFHRTIPAGARTYALPERLRERVHVYGFHGLSHAWASGRVAQLVPDARRTVIAHLGGGESLCAVLDGRSVSTTMGFTPLDGLVMATRSGSLDPGAMLYLARHIDEDLDEVLEKESGLRGLCGVDDMREVLARASGRDDAAVLALEVYLHRLTTMIAGCAASLGGIDVLVFTGGVGENSEELRHLAAGRLAWLGVEVVDGVSVDGEDLDVTKPGASVRTLVVHSREDLQMARDVRPILAPR